MEKHRVILDTSLLTDHDIYLFKEGRHYRLYEKFGSHPGEVAGEAGTHFAVWAPNAARVCVFGDFNHWNPEAHPLAERPDGSGVFEGFLTGVGAGTRYKYRIVPGDGGAVSDRGDPFAFHWELSPRTASVVWDLSHDWQDGAWMEARGKSDSLAGAMSVYEMHLGSWRRPGDDPERLLSYRELAELLPPYLQQTGFTHVEFLPVMEHPFYGSWGYQCLGFFAPSSRYGTPQDFMALVETLHQAGIGVILDWVPSHFPSDAHGLAGFDGTHLYEHADPRQGFHPDWKSEIFNYGRNEVRAFLISSAFFWLDRFHGDGLRVDAVASMLYLDYSRKEGEWIPNRYGGRENIEAIEFLRSLNQAIYGEFPGAETIAEESTAWPMVSRPLYVGGLGFGMKWNMGWMHDTLDYFAQDPIHRKHHHGQFTFSLWYAFNENFVLPLSHDEVVHGKRSLLDRMPGEGGQKFANLRLLFGYMWGHPGKKLLFMGGEFAQGREWNHDQSLDWHLLEIAPHHGVQRWIEDLNAFYRRTPALYELDFSPQGFQWIDFRDEQNSVLSWLRRDREGRELLVVLNATPVPRSNYRIGVPRAGFWGEALNSDGTEYGGSGWGNLGGVESTPVPDHGFYDSLSLSLPPLSVLFLTAPD
ncbi:alpha-1,4-glucan:alpha-1,4-glucan 6-glycosyltransferase [Desulfuromonas soudanensis]|uniref:1,4-alpha-glucan branching enzyme GlgB n=1 Tax=Desulfuromonas soudanensis TaxID=1603606 RepID=A0A0M4D7B4_9BACT|nr:1,4-alpha-glucan branching protein GlgB [Desulfuromonas soudanensis]ALC15342.1 alpha-1,4-glucan:alpha-1,4-glucan 6-glycosyltransferase [Desulfuromonas soudanensis]